MSNPDPVRDTSSTLQSDESAREKARDAALAAFADGKADLAQLLPGRVAPARSKSPPRLVW